VKTEEQQQHSDEREMPILKREKKIRSKMRSAAVDKTSSSTTAAAEVGQDGTSRRRSQRLSVKEEDAKPAPVKADSGPSIDFTSDDKQRDESLAIKTETDLDDQLKPETKQQQVGGV